MKNNPDSRLYLGIDLGTCNTQISVLQGDVMETLPITQNLTTNGKSTSPFKRLPSLICFDEDGKPMFGEVYRKSTPDMSNYTGRVVYNTKRMLLQRPETKVYHIPKRDGSVDTYSPQDIATLLLKRCAEEATHQKNYHAGDKLMITVPCGYQMDQVQATIRAARLAGFTVDEDVELITEPVAALIEYIQVQNNKYPQGDPHRIDLDSPQNVLVYDLGGGTLDLAVVRIEKIGDVFHFTELANNDGERDRTIGGADFDTLVAWKMREKLLANAAQIRDCTVEQIIQRLDETTYQSNDAMLELLHNRAYEMKYNLHRRPAEVNPIVFTTEDVWEMNLEPLCVSMDGGLVNGVPSLSYLDIVRDYLTAGTPRNILDPIPSVLDAALLDGSKLPVSQVDKILITGGMCKFELVRQTVLRFLDQLATREQNPIRLTVLESDAGLEAVSIGAAYSHKLQIENHNEQLSNHYFLDVTSGLPHELVSRGTYRTISLLNPTEALFEIYCGTSKADPDMRKQYTYHKRFNPPLSYGAEVTFRLEHKRDGEAKLIGTIRQPGMENEDIEFKEQTAEVEDIRPAAAPNQGGYSAQLAQLLYEFKGSAAVNRHRYTPSAYQGSSKLLRDAPEGSDKRLFINSSSNHDRSVSKEFETILHLMDLEGNLGTYSPHAGMPIATRFQRLNEIIQRYYWSDPDERRIPVFEYALYAMHQLPLNQLTPPNFPPDRNESSKPYTDEQKELSHGIRSFCSVIGDLLVEPELPETRRAQLLEELDHCIIEWRWQDLFQLCISIAQRAASTKLADALKRRLMRRAKTHAQFRPVSMVKPNSATQQRMTKIYWNALNQNAQLDEADVQNLEILLQGQYCDMDYQWLASDTFAQGFAKLPEAVQLRMRRNNPALRQQDKHVMTLEEVSSPSQLLMSCFKDACFGKNDPQHSKYWDMVHQFLDDPKTCWDMVRVLNRRGRFYDQDTKAKLVTLEPKNAQDRRHWIRTLGYCRTKQAAAKLETQWRTCTLNKVTKTYLLPGEDRFQRLTSILRAAERWLANPDAVAEMTRDNSFELLAALCLYSAKGQETYHLILSTVIATVPSAWISSQGIYGDYWNAIAQAAISMWQNVRGNEQKDYRKTLTAALFHLTYLAHYKYPSGVQAMDQALFNFSKLCLMDNKMLEMYHCKEGTELLRVFARAVLNGDDCPLSASTEKQFLMFLDKRYNAQDMHPLRKEYMLLLVLWYRNTSKLGQAQLIYSDAFRELVGPTPTNIPVDVQQIADGRI